MFKDNLKQKKQNKLGLGLSGGGFRAALFHIGVLAAMAENNKLKDISIFEDFRKNE